MLEIKKVFSFVLSLIMALTVIPTSLVAFAEDTVLVSVENVNAVPGSTVDININIDKNTGIMAAAFTIAYDDGLDLIDAKSGEAFSALSMTAPANYSSPCKFAWDALDLGDEDIKNGIILTLTFAVSESAEPNSELNVEVSYSEKDIIDSNIQVVPVSIVNGNVTIIDYIPGDLNSDGAVDLKDVTLIRRFITGYSVNINEFAADVNGDGEVTMMDVVLIRRYIVDAEGYGVVLVPGYSNVHNHVMIETPAKDATCTEDGNVDYWYCTSCNKYFSDEKGNNEISSSDIVIKAKGHTVVIDPAVEATTEHEGLTEGSHCAVCNKVLVPQTVIPQLEKKEYSITYHLSNGDEYLAQQCIENDNPATYVSEEGVTRFTNPSVAGYQFLGWYDLPSGDAAENIKSIPAGSTGNVDLYARWEKIQYKVSFSSDLIPIESEYYTVDENHVLPSPKLDGYIFAGWSNDNGDVIKNIKPGTVGSQTYSANWISERNQAWTYNELDAPLVYEDEETNQILFVYNIGEIRNVPVSVIHDFGKINSNGVTKTQEATFTRTVSEEMMDIYTNTVQKATTDSYAWTLSQEWTDSVSINETWAKENQVTEEQINSYYKDESSNWYVSNGSSGSSTISNTDSTSESQMLSSIRNKKTEDETSSSVDTTISANLDFKNTTTVGANIPIKFVDVSAENKTEIGFGLSGSISTNDTTSHRVQTDNTDSSEYNKSDYASTTASSTASWNSESGYGGSVTAGQSSTASQAISEKISEEYNIGKSYINTDSQSSTQGTQTSNSQSDQYSSSVTYSTITGEEVTETYTTQNTASGYHRWILAGTAHVFAIVGYDIATQSYFTNTFSVMDDRVYEYEDYSYQTAEYNDNENTVIGFDIPMDITTYVGNRICASEGLEVSKSGEITNYTGTDKYVVIPEYKVIDNLDGTTSVIKVKGISSNAFASKDITGIELSDHITRIPDGAFENCKSLESINAAGITQIGNNAFAGCDSLEELIVGSNIKSIGKNIVSNNTMLTVTAANRSIAEVAALSGAREVYLRIPDVCTDLNDTVISVPNTVEAFIFNGFDKTYKDLRIVSDAEQTIINRANLECAGQIPLVLSSENVELHEVDVSAPGICVALTSDHVDLALRGEMSLTSENDNSMLCKSVSLSQIDLALKTQLTINGNLLIYTSEDSILAGRNYLNVTGNIVGINEDEFANYLKGVFAVSFNANGGNVDESSRTVVYGSTIGELPVPVRDYYTFDGWYTDAVDGEAVTADTVFTATEDVTYYAHWTENPVSEWVLESELPEAAKVVNSKWTYDLTSKTTSSSSSLSGWTKYDTKRTSWGSTQGPVYSDPSNGSRNVWSEQYVSSTTTHYVYYHRYKSSQWSDDAHASSWARHSGPDVTSPLPNGYYSSVTGQRYSGAACSQCGATNQWHLDYTYTTNNYSTRWYYQEPVYTYYFMKTESKESTTEVVASDSISNVKKYVQYVAI